MIQQELTDKARRAIDRLRDFAREHGMDHRQRDPLVMDIHLALDVNTGDPILDAWPNCPTPDCGNKVCRWTGTGVCFPCSEAVIGKPELIRRFNATHDMTWEEAEAADATEEFAPPQEQP